VAFQYEEILLWGRSFEEYVRMFDLRSADLDRRILGCGDGPASFNHEMTRRGHEVVSIDPIYSLSREQIAERIDASYRTVIEQTRREQHRFVWDTIRSVDELGKLRMDAMRAFLEDFEDGRREGRYVAGELPVLPERGRFGLALCSHLLFLYTEQLSLHFHCRSLEALLDVADEVRVFPILDANARPSAHLPGVRDSLRGAGYACEVMRVSYEFQRGGNEMLRVRALRQEAP
jgi:hypothetical protein